MLFSGLFAIAFLKRKKRTYVGVALDIAFGLGAYTALTLGKYVPVFVQTILGISFVLAGLGIILILCRKIKRKNKKKKIVITRIFNSMQLIRKYVGAACVVILIVVPIVLRLGNNQRLNDAYSTIIEGDASGKYGENSSDLSNIELPEVRQVYGDEYCLAENIDTIKLIRDNNIFQKLTYDEKCEVLTAVLRCEGRYLGLEEFDIKFEDMDVAVLGKFNPENKSITINSRQIRDGNLFGGSADEMLNTCIHECRHYFQYLMVELYKNVTPEQRNLLIFTSEGVDVWMKNINDYYSVHSYDMEEYYDYAKQSIEVDARVYARNETEEYHKLIDELLEKQNY